QLSRGRVRSVCPTRGRRGLLEDVIMAVEGHEPAPAVHGDARDLGTGLALQTIATFAQRNDSDGHPLAVDEHLERAGPGRPDLHIASPLTVQIRSLHARPGSRQPPSLSNGSAAGVEIPFDRPVARAGSRLSASAAAARARA